MAIADEYKGGGIKQEENLVWRKAAVRERLTHALVHGLTNFIVDDTEELRAEIMGSGGRPIEVIEGPWWTAWMSLATCLAQEKCFATSC